MTDTVDRYRLGPRIGSGGMSEVFAAEDTLLGREVAVKMLRPEMARDEGFRERFRREAQNAGRLNHPNIVAVFDTGEQVMDGIALPYIVMELVHGRTLRDLIREEGPLAPARAAALLKPAADALQASHEAGIIHRDIKPANIMLTNTGQVKVMDFGIARALDDSTSAMTQTSAVIGTAQYLSPEQARGKHADARSDVYALGCVLYEAITGRTPFTGESPFAVAYQHVQEEPTPPSEVLASAAADPEFSGHHIPDLTPTARTNMDAVVLTAMAKHPGDRYQSAYEMGQDLQRLADGHITQAARLHIPDGADEDAYPRTTVMEPQRTQVDQAYAQPEPVPAPQPAPQAQPEPAYAAPAPAPADNRSPAWMKWLATLLSLVLIGLIGYFAWDFWHDSENSQPNDDSQAAQDKTEMVTVPEVENRPRDEVIDELEKLGLSVRTEEEPHPEIPRDHVIRVNPAAGSELQKDSTVTLTVSTGKENVEVPNVAGQSPDRAASALGDVGLKLDPNVAEGESEDVPAGRIIRQDPAAGTELSKGSAVHVVVSTGRPQVTVPTGLAGGRWDQVRQTLESHGLRPEVEFVDSEEPEDRVLSVSDEGADVDRDSSVRVKVSNGMLMRAPDINRLDEQQALDALRHAGWTGSAADLKVIQPVPTGVVSDEGRIAWTDISNGQVIRKDQQVEVRYWKFDLAALVPGANPGR